MPNPHFTIKIIQRSKGKSAVAGAAYQAGEKLFSEYDQQLSDYFHLLSDWEKRYAPQQPEDEWHPLFVEALQRKSYIEYLLDILLYGTHEEKQSLVVEQRKEVIKLEQRIAEHCGGSSKQFGAEPER